MTLTNKKIIGITGGIGSGKSTFSNILRKKGYTVIDADQISRDLMKKCQPPYQDVIREFGDKILNKDATINRKLLSKLIFKEKIHRDKLEEILHPYIFTEIKRLIDEKAKSQEIIFLDIPLLYETYDKIMEYNIFLDEIYLVYTDRQSQIKRLMNRDNISKEDALRKIQAQISMEEKKKLANKIIYNTGDLKSLEIEIEKVLEGIG